MNYKEALQKIANMKMPRSYDGLEFQMKAIIDIAKKSLEQSEPRMFSELELATLFHNTYERLAPEFGYATREDTKVFDQNSANGKLMVAVCNVILQSLSPKEGKEKGISLMQDGVSMDYDNSSLEPNQTEAEKVLEKYFPNPDDLVNGRVKSVIVKAMETYSEVLEMRIIDLDRSMPKANATLTDQDLIDNPHFKDAGFQQGDSVIISKENGKLQATGVN